MASTIVQHAAVGGLTVALARGSMLAAFACAVVVNGTWWFNVGHRIDLHGRGPAAGVVYALTAAVGVVAGALVVRRFS